jgi:hypothetical protein
MTTKADVMKQADMTLQLIDEQLAIISKLDRECRERGHEIQRQAAEILELTNRVSELEKRLEAFRQTGQI